MAEVYRLPSLDVALSRALVSGENYGDLHGVLRRSRDYLTSSV